MAEIDTTKIKPFLKQLGVWVGGIGSFVTAAYLVTQKEYVNAWGFFCAGCGAFGLNMASKAQLKATK